MRRSAIKQPVCFIAALGVWFFASISTANAQVRAEPGSIAIGGSVTGSTVIIGIPQEKVDELVREGKRPLEELTAQQRGNIALLQEKLDLNERQVRAALAIVGESNIPPEGLATKLIEIAERFKAIQATASGEPGDSAAIATLKADAQEAVSVGELDKADALLARVETEQRRALDHFAVNAAETSARRGDIALARLRYGDAAKHFANAAAVFSPHSTSEEKRIGYLEREASALYREGDEFGHNQALVSAINLCTRLVELKPRSSMPLAWALAQHNLGVALWKLGAREPGTARLEQAVVAFREALKERTRDRSPRDWALTQNHLGIALSILGERERGTAKLDEAVAAYREALKEWSHDRAPLDWARTQNNLGTALQAIGRRERGTAKLEEAVVAYREALKEWTRDRMPLDWSRTQNNLGTVLQAIGRRERGTAKLAEAVAAYREALKEQTRARLPLEWAGTQGNLGFALLSLGQREGGTEKLEEAVAAFGKALKEQTRERVPLEWAMSFGNEGVALTLLAERRGDVAMAETALNQISTAFQTMRDGGHVPNAKYYERQLSYAQAVVARLRRR